MLNKLFSIKNEFKNNKKRKVLTLLGLRLKFKVKETPKDVFKKAVKKNYKKFYKKHTSVISNLRREINNRKIRVCFLVSETQKWNAQYK